MSLYERLAWTVSGVGSSVATGVSSVLGGGKAANAIGAAVGNKAEAALGNAVNRHLPPALVRSLDVGSGVLGDLQRGNVDGAAMRLIDAGVLDKWLGNVSGFAAQAQFRGCPTPVIGGISVTEARKLSQAALAQHYAHKNLFLVEVSSPLVGDFSQTFNLFCTSVDFAPVTLSGEKHVIGSAAVDALHTSDPVELTITTLDDQQGTLRRWFQRHVEAAAPSDGTVGVPGRYAIRFKIVHGFITRGSNERGYEDKGLFRPANLQINLHRGEDALTELQMTFTQLDTFMPP